jgi:pantothenate kinase type III
MNYLIGDIGNTSLKICKINNKFKIVKTFLFRTNSVYLEKDLKKKINQLAKNNICNKILFSSVVPHIYRKIDKIFRKKKF